MIHVCSLYHFAICHQTTWSASPSLVVQEVGPRILLVSATPATDLPLELGREVTDALVATGKHSIVVLTRIVSAACTPFLCLLTISRPYPLPTPTPTSPTEPSTMMTTIRLSKLFKASTRSCPSSTSPWNPRRKMRRRVSLTPASRLVSHALHPASTAGKHPPTDIPSTPPAAHSLIPLQRRKRRPPLLVQEEDHPDVPRTSQPEW